MISEDGIHMDELATERQRLIAAWDAYHSGRRPTPTAVPADLLASWQRSAQTVPPDRVSAPVQDAREVTSEWRESALEFATRPLMNDLRALAQDGDLVVAVADASGRVAWTEGSHRMQRLARDINFVPGGHWDEHSVGTNALALALRHVRPVRVFAAEHFVQTVHEWVCYSSPIRHPESGELLGVLDFSTTWEYSTPLGLAGARYYAQQIENGLLTARTQLLGQSQQLPTLRLRLCGPAEVRLGGELLHLTKRQHELLAVLALHAEGLTLDALHAHVYGEQAVSLSTLKSEVSTLRGLLGGCIASRPYRLMLGVDFDVQSVETALLSGQAGRALDLYAGELLPYSNSPFLGYWREYLDAALRGAVLECGDPEVQWRYALRFDDPEVLQAVADLLPLHDPRRPVLQARLEAQHLN